MPTQVPARAPSAPHLRGQALGLSVTAWARSRFSQDAAGQLLPVRSRIRQLAWADSGPKPITAQGAKPACLGHRGTPSSARRPGRKQRCLGVPSTLCSCPVSAPRSSRAPPRPHAFCLPVSCSSRGRWHLAMEPRLASSSRDLPVSASPECWDHRFPEPPGSPQNSEPGLKLLCPRGRISEQPPNSLPQKSWCPRGTPQRHLTEVPSSPSSSRHKNVPVSTVLGAWHWPWPPACIPPSWPPWPPVSPSRVTPCLEPSTPGLAS